MPLSYSIVIRTKGFGGWVARNWSSPGNVLDNIQALILDMSGNLKRPCLLHGFQRKKTYGFLNLFKQLKNAYGAHEKSANKSE
jgi:hypothetical protein